MLCHQTAEHVPSHVRRAVEGFVELGKGLAALVVGVDEHREAGDRALGLTSSRVHVVDVVHQRGPEVRGERLVDVAPCLEPVQDHAGRGATPSVCLLVMVEATRAHVEDAAHVEDDVRLGEHAGVPSAHQGGRRVPKQRQHRPGQNVVGVKGAVVRRAPKSHYSSVTPTRIR